MCEVSKEIQNYHIDYEQKPCIKKSHYFNIARVYDLFENKYLT